VLLNRLEKEKKNQKKEKKGILMNFIMIISYLKDQEKKDYIKELKEIYKVEDSTFKDFFTCYD